MALAKITRSGLGSIAILVVILWGCVFSERALVRDARKDMYHTLRVIRELKMRRQVEPVSSPSPTVPSNSLNPLGPAVG